MVLRNKQNLDKSNKKNIVIKAFAENITEAKKQNAGKAPNKNKYIVCFDINSYR